MHVVEAADTSETTVREWEGITGRVKQLLEMQDRRVDSNLDSRFEMVDSEFEAVDSKFAEIGGKLDEAKVDIVRQMDSKFEELRSLMNTLLDRNTTP